MDPPNLEQARLWVILNICPLRVGLTREGWVGEFMEPEPGDELPDDED
jgi:hypothetical protein